MSDFVTSFVRTYVPIAVGTIISWLATKGINIDPQASAGLVAFLTGLIIAVYYGAVRLLEKKFPQIGWLLGSVKKPEYTQPQ